MQPPQKKCRQGKHSWPWTRGNWSPQHTHDLSGIFSLLEIFPPFVLQPTGGRRGFGGPRRTISRGGLELAMVIGGVEVEVVVTVGCERALRVPVE